MVAVMQVSASKTMGWSPRAGAGFIRWSAGAYIPLGTSPPGCHGAPGFCCSGTPSSSAGFSSFPWSGCTPPSPVCTQHCSRNKTAWSWPMCWATMVSSTRPRGRQSLAGQSPGAECFGPWSVLFDKNWMGKECGGEKESRFGARG